MIVGGGTGGTFVANLPARKLRREIDAGQVELVLISESPVYYYKPAFMYVAFNLFHHHELARPERH
jgi:sulfide:quinone oxidoreductase